MRRLLPAAFALAALLPAGVCAKGEGVGLWMEGTVSEVKAEGQRVRLVLTGRFWFEQHRNQQASVIEVRNLRTGGPASIPATLRGDPREPRRATQTPAERGRQSPGAEVRAG